MRSFYTLSIWILLGTFAGYGFLTLVGLGDKNEYSKEDFQPFNIDNILNEIVHKFELIIDKILIFLIMNNSKIKRCAGCNKTSDLTKRIFVWKIENLLKYISNDNYKQWYTTYETYLCSICNQKCININE